MQRMAILLGQGAFGKFGGHPKQTGHGHPEDGTGAAKLKCDRNPRNIAQPHRRRHGRRHRLKVADLPHLIRVIIAPPQHVQSVP